MLEKVSPGRQAAVGHRRGRGGRGPRHAGGQQDARHPAGGRGEGPGLRRPPQGHAGRHRHPDRRDRAIFEDLGHQAREASRLGDLGRAKKVIIHRQGQTPRSSKAYGTSDADIEGRIQQIRNQIEDTTSDYDREKLQERLAKLVGGVARHCKVGAATETEMKEKKARVEDALHATRAAVEEGVVPGGGVALVRSIAGLDSVSGETEGENTGVRIVRRALEEPMRQIADNAGHEGAVVVAEVARQRGRVRIQRSKRRIRRPRSPWASSTRPRSCAPRSAMPLASPPSC